MSNSITIKHDEGREEIEVFVNGESVIKTSHDQDGWAGIERIEIVVTQMAEKLGIELIHEYGAS